MATKVWAHRGASAYAPENTIPAFQLAIEQGADGIELDVQETADGKLVVLHDDTVDRTSNGFGRVAEFTCQELKKLDFSCGMRGYEGARIPTLREVYGLIKGSNLRINIEIKYDATPYPGIWDKLLQTEREMGMAGRILYSSFNHYVLLKVRELDPDSEIGLLYGNAMVDPWIYAQRLKADAIHPHYLAAQHCPGLIEGCRDAGIAINAWTVNDAQSAAALAASNVHGIITNCPDVVLRAIGR
ncbi:MAG: glycerophosphodiester phosphodiesterase [Christensenellaceae bacterium]|jgi:glycerophosphoryl diester phosphodiesterase|nr:glycerophosphodiester phosphodiesterase [Christensenellaceae bacterium]